MGRDPALRCTLPPPPVPALLAGPERHLAVSIVPGRTRPPGPAVVPSERQQPMEPMMPDDALAIETKIRENADRTQEVRRQLDEQPSDMGENNQLQDELVELIEERKQLNECWMKALTEKEG